MGEPRCFVVSDHELAKKVLGFDAAAALLVSSISSESRAQPGEYCHTGERDHAPRRPDDPVRRDRQGSAGGRAARTRCGASAPGTGLTIRTISDSPVPFRRCCSTPASPGCPETGLLGDLWSECRPIVARQRALGFRSEILSHAAGGGHRPAEVRPLGHRRHAFSALRGEVAAVRAHSADLLRPAGELTRPAMAGDHGGGSER